MASFEGIISLGPWGGSGGRQWSYRASRGITQIVLIVERNMCISSISFKDADGLVSETFGGTSNDPNYSHAETKLEINWPSEYFISISGTFGRYNGVLVITSLSFITNLTTYGPYGNTSDEAFSIPIADTTVVGFHGRCGSYLDALGISVIPTNSNGSISVGPWGNPGGSNPFSFRVESRIKEVIVHDGGCIYSLSFKDDNDQEYGKYGGNKPNDPGVERSFLMGPSEHLISITGTYGIFDRVEVITSLSFITNLTTYGPFGTATNGRTSFSLPMEGSVVIGFHGRGGWYLDQIGIFVKPETAT